MTLVVILGAIFFWSSFAACSGSKPRKVHFLYPIEVVTPSVSTRDSLPEYVAKATVNKLACFQNHDFNAPTIFQTAICMLPYLTWSPCAAVWGSRSVLIKHDGHLEFLKMSHIPQSIFNKPRIKSPNLIAVNATRWLEYEPPSVEAGKNRTSTTVWAKHIVQVPVEPLTVCVRSTDAFGEDGSFEWGFRHVYFRERDRRSALEKSLYHSLLLAATASVWILPYIVAFTVAMFSYTHGLKVVMALLGFSSIIVCLAPIMLTKKNRQLASQYLHYFFNRTQAVEAKNMLRKRKPLFQALFFSCVLLCVGSAAIYMMYHYDIIDRELRNVLLRLNIAISTSWCTFFLCRSFERFLSDWVWIAMAIALARLMEAHINPLARDKMIFVVVIYSFISVSCMRRILQSSHAQVLRNSFLPSLQGALRAFGISSLHSTSTEK